MLICAYFPLSRFGIRLCSFVPTFRFLGLELGCVHLCLHSVFLGLELGCLFAPIFRFLGLELGCCLRLFSIVSVWN